MNWNIITLDVKPTDGEYSNVVLTAHWDCELTEDEHTVRTYSSTSFTSPSGSFTSFDELTHEQVLGWVWDQVDKDEIESGLTNKLERKKNPPTVRPKLPWLTVSSSNEVV